MENQTQQKGIIKWLDVSWYVVRVAWVVWVAIGQVSDIFFLNPARYWIHEIILKHWSNVGKVLLLATIVHTLVAGGLRIFYRKRSVPEPEKTQQELPKMKEGETVSDYFHRIESIKNKEEEVEVLMRIPQEEQSKKKSATTKQ